MRKAPKTTDSTRENMLVPILLLLAFILSVILFTGPTPVLSWTLLAVLVAILVYLLSRCVQRTQKVGGEVTIFLQTTLMFMQQFLQQNKDMKKAVKKLRRGQQ